jgi:putative endonuclease
MLKCADGSYYIGSATGDDLTKRIAEYQAGVYPGYTSTRRPVRLVWSEYFSQITDAIAVERQRKGWSQAKKEAFDKRQVGRHSLFEQAARGRLGPKAVFVKPRSKADPKP